VSDRDHQHTKNAPVIIIGGGPVGMSVAMNLDQLGVRSMIVNTETDSRWHPKGSTQNARTMEHYRRLGISRGIRALGLPSEHPTDVGYFTRLNGYELARLRMPSEAEKMRGLQDVPATHQTPEPILRCNQMYAEAYVLNHIKTLERVDMRYGWRCLAWRETGYGVSVDIEEVATGKTETVTAQYLVGCDGGQSTVRRSLGIRYGGEGSLDQAYFGGAMVTSYLRAPGLRRVVERPCWQYWAVNPEVRATLVSLDGLDEFLLITKLNGAQRTPDEAAIQRVFHAIVGKKIDVEFIGHKPWTAGQALVADSFGRGRAVLAGDSVHLFTPTGGLGMNTGIDDAANLGWKLAALVQGWGGPGLLASFEHERRPIAFRNTGAARNLARSIGDVPIADAIEDESPEGEEARRMASEFLSSFGEEFASIGMQLGARYDGSPVIISDGSTPPPDDPAIYVPSACPGGRAPHLWLTGGVSLFDSFGPGFSLLRFADRRDDALRLARAAQARRIPLRIIDVQMPEGREFYGRDFALIRPDQHVAWRGDHLPADCEAMLGKVTGW
jgi:2-polyprenyl-6-methoxyphenol hydroxylase-like FAD-dependent oxidoreductase